MPALLLSLPISLLAFQAPGMADTQVPRHEIVAYLNCAKDTCVDPESYPSSIPTACLQNCFDDSFRSLPKVEQHKLCYQQASECIFDCALWTFTEEQAINCAHTTKHCFGDLENCLSDLQPSDELFQ
jgi:hypothetical protein